MAQPTPYTRSTNFNDYSTSNPSSPHQGSSLDAEFNALKTTTDQIRSNLAVIQRDDGKLSNLSVHAESLSNAVLTLIKATSNGYGVKGSWTADTAYAIGDLVESSQATYLCFEAHTSGSTFGANSSKFILLANAAIQTTASAVDKFSGDASTQAFTLTNNTPSGETDVLVFVNGSLLEPTTAYTVTSSQISFTTAPSSGTNNVIVWGTSTAVEAAKQAALSARDTAETHKDDANEHKQTANLWANKVDGTVTDVDSGVDSGEYSAKAYASSTDADEPPTGSAKSWASQDTTAVASSLFSAKEYASGTSATGGTAKQWATKDDGAVASSEYSSKAYANSTDSNEPTTGSSKNWATKTASAEVQSGQGYSSKTYAQDTTASVDTTGGSAKGWASTAEDTAVPGASSSDYSAKHWAAKAETQATNATNQNRFLAPASSDPATRADNSALQTGDFYFNTTDNKMKVRNDATPPAWQDTSSSISSVASVEEFTASDGQGTDSKYFAVVHDVGLEIVWLNGVRLKRGDDYICTNTNSDTTARLSGNSANFVKLETVPGSSDILSIMAFGQIDNNLAVNKAGGAFTGGVTFEAGTTHNTGNNTFTMPTTRGSDNYVLTRDDTIGTGGTTWKETLLTPTVSSISPTNIEESDTTQTIVITGLNFDGAASAVLIDNNGTTKTPTTSTRNSESQITIVFSGSDVLADTVPQPLDVKVTQGGSSLFGTLENALTIDARPVWSSPNAGALSGDYIEDEAITQVNFVATDVESTPTYSVTSGALPAGLSLSSAGALTGTPNVNDTYNSSGVTHNFTVTANDGTGNTTDRAFSILRKWRDGSTSALAATSAQKIYDDTGIQTNGVYYINLGGNAGVQQLYCLMGSAFGSEKWMVMCNHRGGGLQDSRGHQPRLTASSSQVGTSSTNRYSPDQNFSNHCGNHTITKVIHFAHSGTSGSNFSSIFAHYEMQFNNITLPNATTYSYTTTGGGNAITGFSNRLSCDNTSQSTPTHNQYRPYSMVLGSTSPYGGSAAMNPLWFAAWTNSSSNTFSFTDSSNSDGWDDFQDGSGMSDLWSVGGTSNQYRDYASAVCIK